MNMMVQMIVPRATLASCLTGLVFASLSNLRLETGLDGVHGTPRTARLARHEEYTVLLREERVW